MPCTRFFPEPSLFFFFFLPSKMYFVRCHEQRSSFDRRPRLPFLKFQPCPVLEDGTYDKRISVAPADWNGLSILTIGQPLLPLPVISWRAPVLRLYLAKGTKSCRPPPPAQRCLWDRAKRLGTVAAIECKEKEKKDPTGRLVQQSLIDFDPSPRRCAKSVVKAHPKKKMMLEKREKWDAEEEFE